MGKENEYGHLVEPKQFEYEFKEIKPPKDRECKTCKEVLPVSKFKWRSERTGFSLNCLTCLEKRRPANRRTQQTYRDKNPKQSRQHVRKWMTENPEAAAEVAKNWRDNQEPEERKGRNRKNWETWYNKLKADPERFEAWKEKGRARSRELYAEKKQAKEKKTVR